MVLIDSMVGVVDLTPPLDDTSPFCLFALVTGRPCPTCGGSRAIIDLLTGDIDSAVANNLPVTLLALVAALLILSQAKRVVASLRAPQGFSRALKSAGDQIVRHPAVAGGTYLVMWAWNVARW